MAAKKTSASAKAAYAAYQSAGTYTKNKTRDIARHLKRNPNDEAAQAALKAVGAKSSRHGYKGAANPGAALNIANNDRLMSQMKAAVRSSERVYKTVKDKDSLVFGGKIWTKTELKAEFKFVAHKQKEVNETTSVEKKKVRRGK